MTISWSMPPKSRSLPAPPTRVVDTPAAPKRASLPGPATAFSNVPEASWTTSPPASTTWGVVTPRFKVTFCGVCDRSIVLIPVEPSSTGS